MCTYFNYDLARHSLIISGYPPSILTEQTPSDTYLHNYMHIKKLVLYVYKILSSSVQVL